MATKKDSSKKLSGTGETQAAKPAASKSSASSAKSMSASGKSSSTRASASSSKSAGSSSGKSSAKSSGRSKSSSKGNDSRIESIRQMQRDEGNFDCFARAFDGYCDQDGCCFRTECIDLSPNAQP